MNISPVTDKTIGISNTEKFRDVRNKAKEVEERIRHGKVKRHKEEKVPLYKVDDEFIAVARLSNTASDRAFNWVKVIDFDNDWHGFCYYCVLLKTSSEVYRNRIDRLVVVKEGSSFWTREMTCEPHLKDEKIKWIQ